MSDSSFVILGLRKAQTLMCVANTHGAGKQVRAIENTCAIVVLSASRKHSLTFVVLPFCADTRWHWYCAGSGQSCHPLPKRTSHTRCRSVRPRWSVRLSCRCNTPPYPGVLLCWLWRTMDHGRILSSKVYSTANRIPNMKRVRWETWLLVPLRYDDLTSN